jgi:hypothetical protein
MFRQTIRRRGSYEQTLRNSGPGDEFALQARSRWAGDERELARRVNDGFDVRLLWNSETNRVFVTVDDHRHGTSFALDVDAADALEAFHHPFAFTSTHDVRLRPLEHLPAGGAGEGRNDDQQ